MVVDIVSLETAKLAKEKGFNSINDLHDWYYDSEGSLQHFDDGVAFSNSEIEGPWFKENFGNICTAPIQPLLQKWLRDVHNIDIQITLVKAGYNEYKVEIYKRPENTNEYTYFFIKEEDGVYIKYFHTYEEALEEGLQEALKLIK